MVLTALGAVSVLLILFRIIDTPGGGSFGGVSVDVSPAFGIFVSLIAAAGITYGGYLAMQEEGTSFGDVAERFGGGSGRAASPAPTRTPASPPPAAAEGPTASPPPAGSGKTPPPGD